VGPTEEELMASTPDAPTDQLRRQPSGSARPEKPSTRHGRLARRWARLQEAAEAGMSTAEYAVGTVAACAFAAVLYRVVTGGSIVAALSHLVASALATLS
jgi:hypothetical protein